MSKSGGNQSWTLGEAARVQPDAGSKSWDVTLVILVATLPDQAYAAIRVNPLGARTKAHACTCA